MRRRPAAAAEIAAQPQPATSVDTLVVCPSALTGALEAWLQLRRGQGHRCRLVMEFQSAEDIKAAVRETATGGSLRYVVLVGDVVTPRTEHSRRADSGSHLSGAGTGEREVGFRARHRDR